MREPVNSTATPVAHRYNSSGYHGFNRSREGRQQDINIYCG